jgi:D-arabinose 1-dehydrogenase-like Zn-dependent alcohol dehydrogenase
VVNEGFVLHVRHAPEQLAAVAPLLCAGITTWSPLRHWNVGPGKKVGIVGIGGLGHMGVKLAARSAPMSWPSPPARPSARKPWRWALTK